MKAYIKPYFSEVQFLSKNSIQSVSNPVGLSIPSPEELIDNSEITDGGNGR